MRKLIYILNIYRKYILGFYCLDLKKRTIVLLILLFGFFSSLFMMDFIQGLRYRCNADKYGIHCFTGKYRFINGGLLDFDFKYGVRPCDDTPMWTWRYHYWELLGISILLMDFFLIPLMTIICKGVMIDAEKGAG